MTPALASLLNNNFDSKVDARFGNLREQTQANNLSATSANWSVDERMAYGSTTATNRDESEVAEVQGYLKMTR
jgi:hypothetical protein